MRFSVRWLAVAFASCSVSMNGEARGDDRPNIVLIMADDLGYSDLGCFGSEIATPNLDRLASGGLRFSQFYNTSRCCPTRASLMTGLYPHRAGVGRMTFDAGRPGYRGTLRDDTVTIAEVLGSSGYRTMMVGKWHLSLTPDGPRNAEWVSHRLDLGPFSDPASYPVNRGFDEHFGTIWGVVDYFDPFSLVRGIEPVEAVPEGFYYTDAINDEAARMIAQADDDRPFFLYVAHTAPHWPLHAPPEDIDRYADTYADGWDALRDSRYRRMIDLGLIDPETAPLPPRVQPDRSWAENPHRRWDARAMAVHAAMVDRMDRGIGRVLDALEERGKLEDTLILFLSDNGASPEVPGRPGFDRPSHTRDGHEVVYPTEKEVRPGPETTFAGIGPMWANAVNTPMRRWKAETFEGGICTPLIAHWPAGLGVDGGSITEQPGHVIDVMATCIDLAEASYPTTFEGRPIAPMEGLSLVPILRGSRREGHEALFWEHFGARAVRRGDWKLVAPSGRPWQLYNLAEDRTETVDRAEERPDLLVELSALYDAWAARDLVEPAPE